MSELIGEALTRDGNTIAVGTFAGSKNEGRCLQLTPLVPADHFQFTRIQAMALSDLLEDFLAGTRGSA